MKPLFTLLFSATLYFIAILPLIHTAGGSEIATSAMADNGLASVGIDTQALLDQLPKSNETLLTIAILKTTSNSQTLIASLTVSLKDLRENGVYASVSGSTTVAIKVGAIIPPPIPKDKNAQTFAMLPINLTINSKEHGPDFVGTGTIPNSFYMPFPVPTKGVSPQTCANYTDNSSNPPVIWKRVIFTY